MPATKTTPVEQQTLEEINQNWYEEKLVNQQLSTAQTSVVVFMRPFKSGAAVPAGIFEISDNYPQIIDFVRATKKIAFHTSPGKHIFMTASPKGADFIEVDMLPGKVYYVLLKFTNTVYGDSFEFVPVELDKNNMEHAALVQKWQNMTRWSASTKISNKKLNQQSLHEIYSKYNTLFPAWKASENRKYLATPYGDSAPEAKLEHKKGQTIDTGPKEINLDEWSAPRPSRKTQ
jgi:hypothetical protein